MADDITLRGADDLKRISTALRQAAATDLKKELNKGLREGAKPLIAKNRAVAARTLPQRGGLAKKVAKAPQRVKISTGRTPGVSIVAGKAGSGARGADQGSVRHPLFGDRDHWYTTKTPSGWFTDTNERNKNDVLPALRHVLDDVAKKIERRLS